MKKLTKKDKEIISHVESTLSCVSLGDLPMAIYEDIFRLIRFFRYEIADKDAFFLGLSLLKVNQKICDFCNVPSMRPEMYRKFVVAVVGEFLWGLYNTKQFTIESTDGDEFPFDEVVTQIQEGDVKVSFDGKESASLRFVKLLQEMRGIEKQFLQYRKLRW